jgi:hypothetical protein
MPELSHIDPRSGALLVMDYQVDTLTKFMTAAQSADAIACVPDLIAMARDAGMVLIHVVVAFRPGHPEVSPRNRVFSAVKANGMLVAGSEGAAIHPAAPAREGEPVVVKHRISPFVGTDLETLLRANGIDKLVLAGVQHPAASCCRPFATPAILIIGWSSSAIAAPTQMRRCMRCCSTSSSRSRRPSSPRRSSPAPCLAGLHERTQAIDLEKRRHSLTNPFAWRFEPRALRPLHKTGVPVTGGAGFELGAFKYESNRPRIPYHENYLTDLPGKIPPAGQSLCEAPLAAN